MKLEKTESINYDVLVIGGGGSGLRAAIAAREQGAAVCLVTKSPVGSGNNTAKAAGGLSAALLGDDSPDTHAKDTLKAGCYVNDPVLVARVTQDVKPELSFLERCGIKFQQEENKTLIQSASGHSRKRFLRSKKSRGVDFTRPLKRYAAKIGVQFAERVFISRLISSNGEITGAAGLDSQGRFLVFRAPAVILATGGLGQVYLHTDNATGTTGDGYAMAFQNGLSLRDMEFIQYYPTTIRGIRLLNYQSFVLNAGAIIRNSLGEDVLKKNGLTSALVMTRDRAARALMKEILDGNSVQDGLIMDLSSISEDNFQRYRHLLSPEALTGKREFIVFPTVHFTMGGIVINDRAETAVNGLFACGEVTGGVHGANRLAGNALTEIFVMGGIAGQNAAIYASEKTVNTGEKTFTTERKRLESLLGDDDEVKLRKPRNSMKEVLWYEVGIIRTQTGLKQAIDKIEKIRALAEAVRPNGITGLIKRLELDNMLLAAEMITRSSLARMESRGAHYRQDYPEENDNWRSSLLVRKRAGKMYVEKMTGFAAGDKLQGGKS